MSNDSLIEKCSERVWDSTMRFQRPHQCSRKAVRDGKCNIHHPDSIKARQEKSDLRYQHKERARKIGYLNTVIWYIKDDFYTNEELEKLNAALKERGL